MVKYDSLSNIFGYAWDHVVSCYWKKYPNEYSTHVLSEDVIDRRIIGGNKLYTKRILLKTNPLPKWGASIFPSHMTKLAHIMEESVVDLSHHSMVVYTWNISYRALIDLKEKMTLKAEGMGNTECSREGWADSSATGFRRVLRSFGITRWRSNSQKAAVGYERVLAKYDTSGTTEDATADEQVLHLLRINENTLDTIKDAKDKAKHKAIDLASLAAVKKVTKDAQNM